MYDIFFPVNILPTQPVLMSILIYKLIISTIVWFIFVYLVDPYEKVDRNIPLAFFSYFFFAAIVVVIATELTKQSYGIYSVFFSLLLLFFLLYISIRGLRHK